MKKIIISVIIAILVSLLFLEALKYNYFTFIASILGLISILVFKDITWFIESRTENLPYWLKIIFKSILYILVIFTIFSLIRSVIIVLDYYNINLFGNNDWEDMNI